jgi:hypothetical protein
MQLTLGHWLLLAAVVEVETKVVVVELVASQSQLSRQSPRQL